MSFVLKQSIGHFQCQCLMESKMWAIIHFPIMFSCSQRDARINTILPTVFTTKEKHLYFWIKTIKKSIDFGSCSKILIWCSFYSCGSKYNVWQVVFLFWTLPSISFFDHISYLLSLLSKAFLLVRAIISFFLLKAVW